MRMRTPLTRRFTAVLLLVLLTACHSWQLTTVSPQQLIEEEQPDRIRVTRPDYTTLVVTDPTVVNDSIATVLEECQTSVWGGRVVCRVVEVIPVIAVDDVASLEVQREHIGRAAGGAIGLAVGGVLALNCTGECPPPIEPVVVVVGTLLGFGLGWLLGG